MSSQSGPNDKIGELIRRWREALLLSQEQLAEKIEVQTNTISNWERGTVRPQAANVGRLCNALELTPEAFWKGPPTPVAESSTGPSVAQPGVPSLASLATFWKVTIDQPLGPEQQSLEQQFCLSLAVQGDTLYAEFDDPPAENWSFPQARLRTAIRLQLHPGPLLIWQGWSLEEEIPSRHTGYLIPVAPRCWKGTFAGYGHFTRAPIHGIIIACQIDASEEVQAYARLHPRQQG